MFGFPNANLATFVGEQGALRFLKSHFGNESIKLTNYRNDQKDEEIYGKYMVESCHKLDSLYKKLPVNLSIQEKYHKKYFFIKDLILGIHNLNLHKASRYQFHFPGDHLPNNAWFMSYSRYRKEQGNFQLQLDSLHGDLKTFMTQIVTCSKK